METTESDDHYKYWLIGMGFSEATANKIVEGRHFDGPTEEYAADRF